MSFTKIGHDFGVLCVSSIVNDLDQRMLIVYFFLSQLNAVHQQLQVLSQVPLRKLKKKNGKSKRAPKRKKVTNRDENPKKKPKQMKQKEKPKNK